MLKRSGRLNTFTWRRKLQPLGLSKRNACRLLGAWRAEADPTLPLTRLPRPHRKAGAWRPMGRSCESSCAMQQCTNDDHPSSPKLVFVLPRGGGGPLRNERRKCLSLTASRQGYTGRRQPQPDKAGAAGAWSNPVHTKPTKKTCDCDKWCLAKRQTKMRGAVWRKAQFTAM